MEKDLQSRFFYLVLVMCMVYMTSCGQNSNIAENPEKMEGEFEYTEKKEPVLVKDPVIKDSLQIKNSIKSDSLENAGNSEPQEESPEMEPAKKIYKPLKLFRLRHRVYVTKAEPVKEKEMPEEEDLYYADFGFIPEELSYEYYQSDDRSSD
ncbi:MAG: hypothetical protein ACK4ND_19490 [Cytophagaceae bacterium]